MSKRLNCINCNKILGINSFYKKTKRCHSCRAKTNNNMKGKTLSLHHNWKGGLPKCIDCNKQLSHYSLKRCNSCAIREKHKTGIFDNSGKKCHFYIDGRTDLVTSIRTSLEYKNWHKTILRRDNYTCVKCFKSGGNLHVDHIEQLAVLIDRFLKFYNQFSPIEDKNILIRLAVSYFPFWNIENGRTLCEPCHIKTDTYGKKLDARYCI